MKSLILHQNEVVQLSETGIVTVVREVKKIPCECGDWIPYELSATTPEGYQTLGHSEKWTCESCLFDSVICPFGQPGEVRWVRETWARVYVPDRTTARKDVIVFKADDPKGLCVPDKWRSSSTMPQWASRFNVECTGVKVEQVDGVWSWIISYKRGE
jgi:hypothetical protein